MFHPPFNIDAEDCAATGERFANHARAVDKGVQQLRDVFGRVRATRNGQLYVHPQLLVRPTKDRQFRDVKRRAFDVVFAFVDDHRKPLCERSNRRG